MPVEDYVAIAIEGFVRFKNLGLGYGIPLFCDGAARRTSIEGETDKQVSFEELRMRRM